MKPALGDVTSLGASAPTGLVAAIGRLGAMGMVTTACRPSRYATSHLAYELDVSTVHGAHRRLLWKSLSEGDLLPEARDRRPAFVADPVREILVYQSVLVGATGTAECVVADMEQPSAPWLVLEHVDGRELWQISELGAWCAAARWLPRLHRMAAPAGALDAHLLRYDAALFDRWPARARHAMTNAPRRDRARLERVLRRAGPTIADVATTAPTLIHGEFYASNVLVDAATERVCPVDWEMTGRGAPLLDLAALVSGAWSEDDRSLIALAYHDEITDRAAGPSTTASQFLADLDRCRLVLCLQWLGWSPGWVPPEAHRSDWLSTAEDLVERLDA